MRGSWIDFEFDSNDYVHVRIDKKKKILVTTFLQALGVPREQIIPFFIALIPLLLKKVNFTKNLMTHSLACVLTKGCCLHYKDEDALVGKRITKETITLEKGRHRSFISAQNKFGKSCIWS